MNNFSTRFFPSAPICCDSCGSCTKRAMACANAVGVCSHKKPVWLWRIVSSGPPLATATTGVPQYMDSIGTIPKCSRSGVYNTAVAVRINEARSLFEIEVRNMTRSLCCSRSASAVSSSKCSTFSCTFGSYPPAITSTDRRATSSGSSANA